MIDLAIRILVVGAVVVLVGEIVGLATVLVGLATVLAVADLVTWCDCVMY
eukprot:COSAG01_NODE_18040_length_1104_cov_1.094527_1_plen_50_part_00